MSEKVGGIAIDLTADIGPLVTAMKRGATAVSGFASDAARHLNAFGNVTTDLGKKLSVVTGAMAAAAAGALALTKSAADVGDRVAKTARQVGVSTEYYQEMAYAIGQVTNITQDEFDKALTTLNRRMGEAQAGSKEAAAAFEAIGITQADIASGAVTTEMAMDALVSTLSEAQNPALAAAVATDLLGKAGAKMGGQLGGAQGEIASLRDRAKELGIVMGADAIAASEAFGDKWDDLMRSFEALKIKIASELLPVFVNTLIPALQDKVIPAIAQVAAKIGEVIEWFNGLPVPVQEAAGAIATAFAVGGPVLLAIGAVSTAIGTMVAATGPIGLLIAAAALITAAWMTWGEDIKAAIGPAVEWITEKFNAFLAVLDAVKTKAVEVKEAITSALGLDQFGQGGGNNSRAGGGPSYDGQANGMIAAGRGIGTNLGTGIVEGLTTSITEQEGALRSAIERVPQIARDQLGIQSPSRVFAEIGSYVGQGFAEGLASSQALVAASVDAMGAAAITSSDNTVQSILGSMGQLFKGSKPIAAAQALINAYQGATEALKLPFPKNLAAFASVLATGLGAVQSIRSANVGGSTSARPAAASPAAVAPTAAGGGATQQAVQSQFVQISLQGDSIGRRGLGELVSTLNQAVKSGYRIEGYEFVG